MIMENRAEAARLGNVKLKMSDFSATSSLMMFYKHLYDYIRVCEVVNLSSQGVVHIVEFFRFFNELTQ